MEGTLGRGVGPEPRFASLLVFHSHSHVFGRVALACSACQRSPKAVSEVESPLAFPSFVSIGVERHAPAFRVFGHQILPYSQLVGTNRRTQGPAEG